jgi:hypothetical protein
MTTLKVTTDEATWVNLIDELSLVRGTSYIFQNISPVVVLLAEKVTIPDNSTPYHTLLPGLSTRILIDTTIGIWVKAYKDSKGSVTVSVTESDVPLDKARSQIIQGKAFLTTYHFGLGLNAEQDLVFVTPVSDLIFYLEDIVTSTLETQFDIFIQSTISNLGTPLLINNKNTQAGISPIVTVYHTPTITDDGINVYTNRWGSGSRTGGLRIGAGAVIGPNLQVLFRLTSRAAGNWITQEYHWTEDTN